MKETILKNQIKIWFCYHSCILLKWQIIYDIIKMTILQSNVNQKIRLTAFVR